MYAGYGVLEALLSSACYVADRQAQFFRFRRATDSIGRLCAGKGRRGERQGGAAKCGVATWLWRYFTLMLLARLAYLRVLRVSSKLQAAGESAASIAVSELPPSDSCKTLVSLELRYGTKTPFLPFATSTSALMTLPRLVVG